MVPTKKEISILITKLFEHVARGSSDDEIASELGLPVEEIISLKGQMLEIKSDEMKTKPIEHVYIELMLNQLKNIYDLTTIIDDDDTKASSKVTAIRARSEIYDKLVIRGQECGIFKKVPDSDDFMGGVILAELSNAQLRAEIKKGFKVLQGKMRDFGESDFLELPVPTEIHRGKSLEEKKKEKKKKKKEKAKASKTVKAKMHKVTSGGRKKRPKSPLMKKAIEE